VRLFTAALAVSNSFAHRRTARAFSKRNCRIIVSKFNDLRNDRIRAQHPGAALDNGDH